MRRKPSRIAASKFRNFMFGVEDSLVSTVGLLSGVAIAETPRSTIILTGLILIFVEAFSMGVGSFLSEHTAEEYEKQKELGVGSAAGSAITMFVSYFAAGFIPLFPYLVFTTGTALIWSISLALLTLVVLGIISARRVNGSIVRKTLEMLILGGLAVSIGVIVGRFTLALT